MEQAEEASSPTRPRAGQDPVEPPQPHHYREEEEEEADEGDNNNTTGRDDEEETMEDAEPIEDADGEGVNEEAVKQAQVLLLKIVLASSSSSSASSSRLASPNPCLLHALAHLLEKEESRFLEEYGPSFSSSARSSHTIGRISNFLRENDEFYELVSSKFLSESRFSTSVRAAAARLLLACAPTWVYPYVFEESVLDNIIKWATEDVTRPPVEEGSGLQPSVQEMLKTYSIGLLVLALNGNSPVVEVVLNLGLAAKLMRFLRVRILGETSANQKDAGMGIEGRQVGGSSSFRAREDGKNAFRHISDVPRPDFLKFGDVGVLSEQIVDKDTEKATIKDKSVEDCIDDRDQVKKEKDNLDLLDEFVGKIHAEDDNLSHITDEKRRRKELREGKCKLGVPKSFREDEVGENSREDSSKRRSERGTPRHRGKSRVLENGDLLSLPGTGMRMSTARITKDRHTGKFDSTECQGKLDDKMFGMNDQTINEEENDEAIESTSIGRKDVSEMVMEARTVAQAEARAANASFDAILQAGDHAADLVKSAAAEVLANNGNEEEALAAAANALAAVVNASLSTEVSREAPKANECIDANDNFNESEVGLEDEYMLNLESLGRLREQFSIQCMERLGEYVEVLGPVLHEKGVDVCLALLQRESKNEKSLLMLSDLLKLICALAAHRKFAALFVDRGGVQKLLSVPRVPPTFIGLSMCLFAIASLQGVMERVCALPADVVHSVVELALYLLDCNQDQARRNTALFFGVAFVFRAVLDAFDAKDGLQKMLDLLKGTADVRLGISRGGEGESSAGNSNGPSARNDRAALEVLTAAEKQIAYHTCVAMRQYFRAHLLLLVDTLRPNKSHRSGVRAASTARAAYKPIDISNEANDSVLSQLQHDRKLGPLFVRSGWPAVQKFIELNGHAILLELCQAPPGERYLHDLALYALGVLHIVTLVPASRKVIVSTTLSNDRVGMAVILEAASGATYGDTEVIHVALLVLVNLVCPPPSISSKATAVNKGANSAVNQLSNAALDGGRDRNPDRATPTSHQASNGVDRISALTLSGITETKELNGDQNANGDRNCGGNLTCLSSPVLVGDRRISLGPGQGNITLANSMELCYRQAREAVRANNGIRVLLHLFHPRTPLNPTNLDCIRALSCRVLLGLAKDDTIAHILTKLQVGKLLSELVRDLGSQNGVASGEKSKWQAELSQVAMELIAIVTNAGRATTLAATDAAAPTLRRIERAAIAASTPITYHSRELLQLIHEHLVASGLTNSAAELLKEAKLTPLPSVTAQGSLPQQRSTLQEPLGLQFQWPSGRVAGGGFMSETSSKVLGEEESASKFNNAINSTKKKTLGFSLSFSCNGKTSQGVHPADVGVGAKDTNLIQGSSRSIEGGSTLEIKVNSDISECTYKTPNTIVTKRKMQEREPSLYQPVSKRPAITDSGNSSAMFSTPCYRRNNISVEIDRDSFAVTPAPTPLQCDRVDGFGNQEILDSCLSTPVVGQGSLVHDSLSQSGNCERTSLDSLVVQYLKHQHRQCPFPITTLPPLPLSHPHVCPEASRALEASLNTAGRLISRQFRTDYGRMHGHRRDRQFIFSRFRPWRTCRDDNALLTSITFLGTSSRIASGSHAGEIKIFDTSSGNLLESHVAHPSPITVIQCAPRDGASLSSSASQLLLTSCNYDVRLWDSSTISNGQFHTFENCRSARFNHSGSMFAAISTDISQREREILLYDVQSCNLERRLSDNSSVLSSSSVRGSTQSLVHFSPSDSMLLWNGVLWDHRLSTPVHRFDQFTDYGGGGFHPAGNEVIINAEVWDLRKFRLLRTVPSLDQTVITFNATGDIIYATLRRNLVDIMSALHHRRTRHPLWAAFRTMDAVHYTDIALTVVDRCVLDLATEPTDSFIGLVLMDDSEEMDSSARIYEIGRRRPTDDDSDPDDGLESDEEDDIDSEADEDGGEDGLVVDIESDSETMMSSDEDDDSVDDGDDFDSNDEEEDAMGGDMLELTSDAEGSHGMDSYGSDGTNDDSVEFFDHYT